MLLSITCPVLSTFGGSASDIVASQWLENSSNMDQSVKMFVLTTITSLARHMSSSNRNKIIRYLITELKTYRVSLSTIKYMVVALSQLMEAEGSDSSWVKDMATEIETFLSDIVYGDQYDEQYVSKMPHYLITLGEVCLHNPIAISNKLIQIIQCLLITPKVQEKGTGVLDERKQPKFISDLAEGLLPAYLRRATVHCIGQMCLQHEQLAKQTIPVLARELELSTDSVIKKTAVTIICDLCKLYTNAVGPYISSISSCLKDKDPGVNKTTFISLTRLLQEDFLKWRGSLFYRFISCIVSEDADVAELAKVTFIHELSKRHKGMYTQHFVECLFHFNDYTGHKSYNRFPQTESERKLFSLAGEDNSEKRHSIYCFMLEYMTDSQKFSTTEKLCQDVLSAAVEKTLPLNSEQPAAILIDALSILQSKNIKLSITKASTEALIDGLEEMTPSQATTAKAATVQVTKLLKKSFVETVIPDIISLKSLLEANHSPMIKHLMLFLIELTKDYKAELADLLAGNEQLSAELAFDIRKFEEKEAAAAAETVAHEAVHTATPTVERQAQCATTPFNTTSNAAAAHAASIPHTPASQPLSGTPRRTALGGTPAMPPPPLRSAMKKPEHSSTHLLRSAKKLARDREKLKGSQQVMSRKVNFNEDEENEEPEPCESSFSGVPSTPLLDIASAAVGARAISTPDGGFKMPPLLL
ncbi:NCAPD3 [Bugula neritina]|uniref:NCAPD3 n=1 Tax=Bugula neritina TaxID=10212 RepID=A0A7J7JSW2_BUGNE|nr:NCAPD3 [Bugula neritina]